MSEPEAGTLSARSGSRPERRSWDTQRWVPGFLLLLLLFAAGCGSSSGFLSMPPLGAEEQPPATTRAFRVFLIGDAGAPPREQPAPTLRLLQDMLAEAGPRSAVVFLGDNIYPSGLPPAYAAGRPEAERRLMAQIEAVEDAEGHIVFVPGNHDWGNHGIGGDLEAVLRQEAFVENVLDRGNTFLPDNGFPGPVEVPLSDRLTLVVLDTQWWLEEHKTYGDTGQYELEQEGSVLIELDDILRRNADKDILVVAHHPMFTAGEHGGRFGGRRDWFPIPLSRRYLGTPQDLSNLKYRRMRNSLLAVMERHEGLVYAAGHEHNLQYFRSGDQHYLVSGSGSKSGHVAQDHGAAFVSERKGFATLDYHTSGSVWLTFWAPEGRGETGEALYRTRLKEGTRPLVPLDTLQQYAAQQYEPASSEAPTARADTTIRRPAPEVLAGLPEAYARAPYPFFSKGTVPVTAGDRYDIGSLQQLVLGRHYRDVWSTPVEVPVLDLERTAGGLTPIKKGGGFQTRSLRLQGADGKQYVLRSVDKDPSRTVPEYLRETIAQDVVQDQISAMLPYGAFVLPRLAEAAGIYHTYPLLVYVPDDERLGIYREEFGGMLALFETRPDEDQSDAARFGFAENVVGWEKLEEELAEDNDNRVDARAFARARLFDMLIGDWDRHKDQWRWAEFETEHGELFRPVPRDRDFAFFKFDGLLSRLSRLTGVRAFRRFTNFGPDYGDLVGLNVQGVPMDRRYTASLTREDWVAIADSLRERLTDETIEAAARALPEPVFERRGAWLVESLKARRDDLPETADEYYDLLAHTAEVVGSDKHERFEVRHLEDEAVEVVVYKTKKEGDLVRELFRRTFQASETEEVRLYGLGGNDQFVFEGSGGRGIRVRAIGGPDEDLYLDRTTAPSHPRILAYDTEQGNHWETGPSIRPLLSNEAAHNAYVPARFEQSIVTPATRFGWNADDGLILGGGLRSTSFGFRKDPFAVQHQLDASVALRTRALNAHYFGRYTDLVGEWNGNLEARLLAVRNFRNFYGFGNETEGTEAVRERFQARLGRVFVEPALSREPFPFTTIRFGPRFEYTDVEPPEGWAEDDPRSGFAPEDFIDQYFAGALAEFNVDGTDTLAATESGARWLNRADLSIGVRHTHDVLARLSSELSYFYTFHLPQRVTLALRAGGATNIGDFAFYQANMLGGQTYLRGFRKNRFAGRTAVYTNAEVRVPLFDFNAYLTRGEVGLMAFLDNGRVWADGEDSNVWHQGYGGGFWLTPFYQVALTGTVGFSSEETVFAFSLGFLF